MAQHSVMSLIVLLSTALVISVRPASALPDDRRYEVGDYIPLFANKVHPLHDRCSAFPYFNLPFCPPGSPLTNRNKSMDEVLEGDCFTNTLYDLKFKVDKIGETLCEKQLTKDEVAKFRYTIKNRYEFQMYYNNIGMRGLIGHAQEQNRRTANSRLKYYLVKHIDFYAYYIGNQVNSMYLGSDFGSAVDITEDVGIRINFTYSVFWKELVNSDGSVLQNETAVDKLYGRPTEKPGSRDIALLHIFLAAQIFYSVRFFVSNMPYLLKFTARYDPGDVELIWGQLKWKQIHGNACRCPSSLPLLSAILGTGTQLLILICFLFLFAYEGFLEICDPKELFISLFLLYSLTSVFSGYTAASFHSRYTAYTAIGWKECIFLTGVLYSGPVALTALVVNVPVEILYGSSDLPEFSTAVGVLLMWGFGTISILCLGGKIWLASRSNSQGTCATSGIPRRTLQPSWYMKTPAQMFLGGLLPFMTIFPSMDNIYASLWKLKVCGAFRTMLMSFILVIMQTIVVGIIFTYLQLSKQDYQWWWRSVFRGGSTAIFMFAYGIYFHSRVYAQDSNNLLLVVGYNACIFYAFFLVLGTIGFYSSSLVFNHMYKKALKRA